jgi:NitT/TauT family transport system ATP-binding protein
MRGAPEAPVEEPLTSSATSGERRGGAAIALSGVGHRFGSIEVVSQLEQRIAPGEVTGIVGPSGSGKSTLLELVAGLLEPTAGSISVDGHTLASERLARCAYMPQRDLLLPWLAAIDNAGLAARNRGASRAEARATAAPLFERFGLAGFEASRPGELSGGMRQRVAFLRTLLAGKPVLLLDEPFASLDAISRGEMQQWLAGALAADRRTTVLVTHDVEEALYLSDRVAVLSSRPATVVEELRSPSPRATERVDVVTSPAFGAARERALEALAGGSRG